MLNIGRSSVASIAAKSKSIYNVFTKTKEQCLALNTQIDGLVTSKTDEVNKLQAEISELNTIKTGHNNLATKIDSFLNS